MYLSPVSINETTIDVLSSTNSKQRSALNKSKNQANERDARVIDLQAALEQERVEGKKSMKLIEEEVTICSVNEFLLL
jgi:DNA-binding protein H-NS